MKTKGMLPHFHTFSLPHPFQLQQQGQVKEGAMLLALFIPHCPLTFSGQLPAPSFCGAAGSGSSSLCSAGTARSHPCATLCCSDSCESTTATADLPDLLAVTLSKPSLQPNFEAGLLN